MIAAEPHWRSPGSKRFCAIAGLYRLRVKTWRVSHARIRWERFTYANEIQSSRNQLKSEGG